MYYVNKIVGLVMSPMGLLFLGIAVGIGLRRLRGLRGLGNWAIGLTLVLFWMLGCDITTRIIGVGLEGEEAPEAMTLQVGGYDAIVVLGGGIGIHERCGRVELFGSADRIWKGVQLHKAYGVPLILGGGMNEKIEPLMRDFGVAREAWTFVDQARNTEEEAKMIRQSLDTGSAAQKPRVLLVTSAWHMPRAQMLFARAGLDVVAAPTDYEMHCLAERSVEFGDFFPNAEALSRNSYAAKEWVARFGYALLRR